MRTRLELAQPQIRRYFDGSTSRVYQEFDLGKILTANRAAWHLGENVSRRDFVTFLTERLQLRKVQLQSKDYGPISRFTWGSVTPFELALSLRRGAYLSHGTAVFLHGLTDDLPATLYANVEQSQKPRGVGPLPQEKVDLAFSHSPRTSRYIFSGEGFSVVLLNGKASGRLEVGRLEGPDGEWLEATKLERTLIDIAVRPAYAGGVFKVLAAYEAARNRASVNTLVATLKKLQYLYPYHQAIGFLMERAGYPPDRLEALRALGIDLDFYLCHGIRDRVFDSRWRLYIPKGL